MNDRNRDLDTETKKKPASGPDASTRYAMPCLTIAWHPDPGRIGERVLLTELTAAGGRAEISRRVPVFHAGHDATASPLADPFLSRKAIVLQREELDARVRLLRNGSQATVQVDGQDLRDEIVVSEQALENGVTLELAERIVLLLHMGVLSPPGQAPELGMVGKSGFMTSLRQDLRRVADLPVPVLLLGETGTGKELIAHAIHQASGRPGPFVAINMGAIPPPLASAELFGAARGAFTGAQSRPGYFGKADRGTLFLDEIGTTPLEIQSQLLRTLETGEIQPLGSTETPRVDVRLVAATDADLEDEVEAGRFLGPLLHRLCSFPIRIAPLRERREDIGRLWIHFLREALRSTGEAHRLAPAPSRSTPWLDARWVGRLVRHAWPGNVRQLRNMATQLVIASRGRRQARIPPELERQLRASPQGDARGAHGWERADPPPTLPSRRPESRAVEPRRVAEALRSNRWSIQGAADELGVSRTVLYKVIEESEGLRTGKDLGAREIRESLERNRGRIEAMVDDLEVSRRSLQRRMTELGIVRKPHAS